MWACTLYSEVAKLRPDVEFQDNLLQTIFTDQFIPSSKFIKPFTTMHNFPDFSLALILWLSSCHKKVFKWQLFVLFKKGIWIEDVIILIHLNIIIFTQMMTFSLTTNSHFQHKKLPFADLFMTTWVREQEPEKKNPLKMWAYINDFIFRWLLWV